MSGGRPSAVIFDLDGTLVDSHREIAATLRDALEECGLPPMEPLPRDRIGPPLDALLRALLPGAEAGLLARVRATFVRRYDASDYGLTEVFPWVRELLALLAERRVRAYVATAKRDLPTRRMLAALGLGPFARVECVDTTPSAPRSKSSMVGALVQAHGPEGGGAWMVGDTAADLRAAHDHGLVAVAAAYGYGDPAALAEARPHVAVGSPRDLFDLVDRATGDVPWRATW